MRKGVHVDTEHRDSKYRIQASPLGWNITPSAMLKKKKEEDSLPRYRSIIRSHQRNGTGPGAYFCHWTGPKIEECACFRRND